jgi:hypothetical protein
MKNLLKKMLEIQKELKPIEKTETNPYYKSKYFDINAVIALLKPLLNKHGVVVTQPLIGKTLVTRVYDVESEEMIESVVELPEQTDPQKHGALQTYFRRYALTNIFMLEAEDDDGNAAVPVKVNVQTSSKAAVAPQPTTLHVKNCKVCAVEFRTQYSYADMCTSCYAKSK